jgi:tripartite-type tricarboxylate transporter receptor subunit TctC
MEAHMTSCLVMSALSASLLRLSPARAAIAIVLFALSGQGVWSQSAKTIKVVVPYPAGGPTDTVARLLADQIGHTLAATIVVENRPGAAGIIGTEAASRAIPDGSTVTINAAGFLLTPHLQKLNYEPLRSFEPICKLVSSPLVIAVNNMSPHQTFADLLSAARVKPGELTLASVGPATLGQLGFEMLKRAANVDMTFVPYGGMAPAVNDLLGGHVASLLADYAPVAEQVRTGKMRALATASRTRIEPLPDVPAIAESGYVNYEVDNWFGLFAPAGTPKEAISQLSDWFTMGLRAPETESKLVAQGLFPVGSCGVEFRSSVAKQYDDYGRIVREVRFKVD